MNQLFSSRPFLKIGILGLLLLPFLFLIDLFSPEATKIPQGYSSSIVAFEFASSQSELEEVLGALTLQEVLDMDRINYVDFGFMLIYGIFLFLFISRYGEEEKASFLLKARWFVPIAVLFDLLENFQLLKLNSIDINASNVEGSIQLLSFFTWIKWLLLAALISGVGWVMLRKKGVQIVVGIMLCIPVLLGLLAVFTKARSLENSFASLVFLGFAILFIYCFVHKSQTARN